MISDILFGGGARATLENPSTSLSNPDAWLYDSLGATPATSGVRVNQKTALRYSAFWRGVNLLSSTVAKLPCFVYRHVGDNGKERDKKHFAHMLVRRRPNSEMSVMDYYQTMMCHVLMRGNHYSYIERMRAGAMDGQARELIPLDPSETFPVRENGQLLYVTRVRAGLDPSAGYERRKLLPENVIHIKGLGYDGLVGYDVLECARNSLGLGLAVEEYGARFFSNNSEPSVVIETPKTLSAKARAEFRQEWNSMHAGLTNSNKMALLQEGATIKPFSLNARQSQLLETREFELKSIANWLGIPVHKVGHDGHTSYNSLEMENQSFLDEAIDPWLVKIEQEFYEKLLTEEQKKNEEYTIEFLRAALVRADIQARYQSYQIAIQFGIMSRNEVRSKENMNPVDGGDEFVLPANIFGDNKPQNEQPGKDDDDDSDDSDNPPEDKKPAGEEKSMRKLAAQRRLLISATGRAAKRLALQARKAVKAPKKFDDWLSAFESEHRDIVHDMIYEVVATISNGDPYEHTQTLAGDLFSSVRADLNAEYSSKTEREFAGAVDTRLAFYEARWPELAVDKLWPTLTEA